MINYVKFQLKILHHRMFTLKTAILLGVLWNTEDMMLRQIVALGKETGEKIIPAAYVFLQSSSGFLLIFFLEIMVFYIGVPFTTNDQLYVFLRSGKSKWYLNQVVYIVVSSLMILVTAFLFCVIRLMPILKFSWSWDRILGTLALTDAGQQFGIVVQVPYKILNRYEPAEAVIYSVLIGWGVICLIGMLMFSISLVWNRRVVIIIMTVMILLFGIQRYYPAWVRYLVPLSWVQITELGVRYSEFAPTQKYVCTMLPIFLCCTLGIGFWWTRKRDFEWIEEE